MSQRLILAMGLVALAGCAARVPKASELVRVPDGCDLPAWESSYRYLLAQQQPPNQDPPLIRALILFEHSYPDKWADIEQAQSLLAGGDQVRTLDLFWRGLMHSALAMDESRNPFERLGSFQTGMREIDEAIQAEPDCLIFRLKRAEALQFVPAMFGRKDLLKQDLSWLHARGDQLADYPFWAGFLDLVFATEAHQNDQPAERDAYLVKTQKAWTDLGLQTYFETKIQQKRFGQGAGSE